MNILFAMKTKLLTLLVGFFLFSSPMAFSNHDGAGHEACKADIQKLCGGMEGWDQIGSCLKKNASKLSPACKAHHEKMKAKMEAFHKTCGKDIAKLCKSKKGHETFECLKENKDKASAGCQALLSKHEAHEGHEGHEGHESSEGAETPAEKQD